MEKKTLLGADFRTRLFTAAIGGPIVLAAIVAGGVPFGLAVAAVGIVAAIEFHHMIRPDNRTGLVMTALVILACIVAIVSGYLYLIFVAVTMLLLAGLAEASRVKPPAGPFFKRNYGLVSLGALYIGIPLGLLLLIRNGDQGLLWTAMLFINNWATDGFALIGGRIAGRHKLAPKISPGKTIEGALIGLISGCTIGFIIALAGGIPVGLALIANILVSISVEIGDLIESWTKRQLTVKDSGSILPGHGGFLDRIDGTLVAAVSLYGIIFLLG